MEIYNIDNLKEYLERVLKILHIGNVNIKRVDDKLLLSYNNCGHKEQFILDKYFNIIEYKEPDNTKCYKVTITETLQKYLWVKANSEEEAKSIVDNDLCNEEITLDEENDFYELDIRVN